MNITKQIGVAIVAAIAVVAAAFGLFHPSTTIQVVPDQSVVKGTSPEFSSPYIIVNGVQEWYARVALKAATTTPCSILSPAATSTVLTTTLMTTVATSSANLWVVSTSTSAFASSSVVNIFSVAANQNAFLAQGMSSTSQALGGALPSILPPSTYVNWTSNLTTANASWPAGYCQATFILL